ncbi:3-deoxy-D-manno-octulosonic acid transferase [Mameliella alba]|nr:3-deoxy-D-manno-octulosonic acid transferase [Mameliella alba]MBY6169001.1 3-deoxy-D-manno-octulosonic acid transferase [Mameliella alba]MBY6173778.1 3-deoxy-D-manno-octulosonic acid transferase [Mameliella alba]
MVRRALSLSAYLAYARSASAPGEAPTWPQRPTGPLVWGFAEDRESGRAMASLAARLTVQRPEITFWLSGRPNGRNGTPGVPLPRDVSAEDLRTVRRLRPDVTLWTGQTLRPGLLTALAESGSHMIALGLSDTPFQAEAPRWLPDPAPAVLSLFHSLYTTGPEASRRLRRLGIEGTRVHDATPFLDTEAPLECADGLHEEITGLLAGRPVWLAARLRADEAGDVLYAHRQASRLAHRLLLVIAPQSTADAARIARMVRGDQMRVCDWENGEMPDENTQILLAGGPEELGLWYRLAPLAFVGGSLTTGGSGEDPFEAAALGTAVLYGPNVGGHLEAYSRLVSAGAARIVRDADSLGAAVSHLVAPDQAATMAHAGWDVISSGAQLVDRVLAEVFEHLDAEASA